MLWDRICKTEITKVAENEFELKVDKFVECPAFTWTKMNQENEKMPVTRATGHSQLWRWTKQEKKARVVMIACESAHTRLFWEYLGFFPPLVSLSLTLFTSSSSRSSSLLSVVISNVQLAPENRKPTNFV